MFPSLSLLPCGGFELKAFAALEWSMNNRWDQAVIFFFFKLLTSLFNISARWRFDISVTGVSEVKCKKYLFWCKTVSVYKEQSFIWSRSVPKRRQFLRPKQSSGRSPGKLPFVAVCSHHVGQRARTIHCCLWCISTLLVQVLPWTHTYHSITPQPASSVSGGQPVNLLRTLCLHQI